MKILHTVEFYHPIVGGMPEVARQISERLAAFGHQVTVATSALAGRGCSKINGVAIEEFAVKGKLALGMSGEVERYQRFLRESGFDIITNFAAQQWATDAMLTQLDKISAKKVFVPTGFSELGHPRFKDYFASMGQWMARYDMNVFLSDSYRDIEFARQHGVRNIMLIPNGASGEEFLNPVECGIRKRLGIPATRTLILHVGSHTGLKGHAEAIRIFSAARISNATLLIVANDFGGGCATTCRIKKTLFNLWPRHRADGKQLIVTALSREDTVAAYQAADLFLFPSNIECSPLVLFECMASRTPFLTTDVGNAAEIIGWSGGGVLLPTSRDGSGLAKAQLPESAAMLSDLCSDLPARQRMAQSGFSAWQERFTWDRIARRYEALYDALLKGGVP